MRSPSRPVTAQEYKKKRAIDSMIDRPRWLEFIGWLLLHQAQDRPVGLALQTVAMKPDLGPILERLHTALQLGGTLGIRRNTRTHR
jgi:hypothetical protein